MVSVSFVSEGKKMKLKKMIVASVVGISLSAGSAVKADTQSVEESLKAITALAGQISPVQPGGSITDAINPFSWMMSPLRVMSAGNPFVPFLNPTNWVNPSSYGRFLSPDAYAKMLNPLTYANFFNPMAYAPLVKPSSYTDMLKPETYKSAIDPDTYLKMINDIISWADAAGYPDLSKSMMKLVPGN